MNCGGSCCGDEFSKLVQNGLLQGCVGFDGGHEDGEVSFELVGEVSDSGVVLGVGLVQRE